MIIHHLTTHTHPTTDERNHTTQENGTLVHNTSANMEDDNEQDLKDLEDVNTPVENDVAQPSDMVSMGQPEVNPQNHSRRPKRSTKKNPWLTDYDCS